MDARRWPCVLLLHGFPDLPQTWEELMPALDEAGYKAVAVTNRGYETSSISPLQDYQLTTLASDVFEWLEALGEESVHLIGHDWGLLSPAQQQQRNPRCSDLSVWCRCCTQGGFAEFATKSLKQLMDEPLHQLLFQLQGTAERKVSRAHCEYLETLWRRWSPGWSIPEIGIAAVRERFQDLAIVTAALSYYRQGADTRSDTGRASRALAQSPITVPTLGIHGETDGCIDPRLFRRAMIARISLQV
ncbi:MAG: epoxide hydrolase [Halieaceae bacterium]|nr:MAG: epoxide hydrolase [Halieaceae bacterium]